MESVRCEVPEAFRRNLKKSWKCLLQQEKTEQPWKIKGRRRDDGSNRSSDGTSSAFDHTGGWTRTGTGNSGYDCFIPQSGKKDCRVEAVYCCGVITAHGNVCRLFSYFAGEKRGRKLW